MKPYFCKISLCSQIIHLLLGASAFNNTARCTYEKPVANPSLTLPATVTYTYTGAITSQTECATECCSKEGSCAGFTYVMGSKTCLMAVKVRVILMSMSDMKLFNVMQILAFYF